MKDKSTSIALKATDDDAYSLHTNKSAILPLISTESYGVTLRWNRLDETIPTNGHNIGIGWEIRKFSLEETHNRKQYMYIV